MSLLLDALKKAATEKEKLKSSEGNDQLESELNETNSNEIEDSEALDLDLDMPEENDIYPEIDEEIELPEEQAEEKIPESSLDSDESIIIEEELSYDSDDAEEIKEPEILAENNDKIKAYEKEEIVEVEATKKPASKRPNEIENKEALSELINKSNKFSKRRKSQTKIVIVSSLVLVFFITSGYLYLEFSMGSQDIYIKNKENNPLKKLVAQNQNADSANIDGISRSNQKIKPLKKIVPKIQNSQRKRSKTEIIKPVPVKKRPIKIARKIVKDPTGILVRQAYIAFNQQDYKTSEKLYKKASKEEPKNRDALLGLAAIAVKQQRYEYARQKYLQLRRLNPKDSIAIAGLSAIQNKINSAMSESELKFVLHEQPESAHLYFALGSIYANQKKWADAQVSFFSAWSAENTNADYAYNLAVSLDQLGKKAQAKQLYALSLKLNKTNKWNFSNQTVEKRIRTLNENSR